MSIFEPIPREPRWGEDTQELDVAWSDGDAVPTSGSLDPRSIKIAGITVIVIVIAGLVASNMAEPEDRPDRLVTARVEPGAAAVEQAEAKRSVPTTDPTGSTAGEPDDETDGDAGKYDGSRHDSRWSGDGKWGDKPGKGNGRGRG
jgi:hypothetical protein